MKKIFFLIIFLSQSLIFAREDSKNLPEGEEAIPRNPVHVSVVVNKIESTVEMLITLDIMKKWAIQHNKPEDKKLIPTSINFNQCTLLQDVTIEYPAPATVRMEIINTEEQVYVDKVSIKAIAKYKKPGFLASCIKENVCIIELVYQACRYQGKYLCLRPESKLLDITKTLEKGEGEVTE